MRYILTSIIALYVGLLGASAQSLPVIPLPAEIKPGVGSFTLTSATKIVVKTESAGVRKACDLFLALVNPSTGLDIGYAPSSAFPIVVELDSLITNPEGYQLKVTPRDVTIRAQTPAGIFYAFQTLRQMLPPMIESRTMVAHDSWKIPAAEINDAPRFPYRGLMLDVVRHFFPVNDIKRYIDLMAMHKFNYLHLHLTDDQGWRIEIPGYPELQSISAWRKETLIGHLNDEPHRYDGARYGGYYTQAELKELVRYAADRHVAIVPEIEMPGHATALLAAHPELACSGSYFEVARDWGIFPNLLCPKEDTFLFLEHILFEVMNIFPDKYIHIGGDECPKEQWQKSEFCHNMKIQNDLQTDEQLQTWFMRRIARYVQSYGRQVIGWDELLDGGNIPGAVIMSWRGEQGGVAAARKGNRVIMTPHRYCYFDYYQWRNRNEEPLAAGSYLPLSMVYMYDPIPKELTGDQKQFIMGAQGNLWTEYIADERQVEYMAYPRACALSEVTWSPADRKSYNLFLNRLREHSKRLEMLNVNFARHLLAK
ncbi:MAG: beta-N-acetylhexosaminidase [Bacteroidales bacterium]|jgi:hexosaminidase|nr:beta-N-acetylhexosaminidase [Bacteroidales bacterium]